MGLLDRILNRPPTRDQFARMMLKRIRKSGDQRPIEYDAEKFQFRRNNSQISFLGNVYLEYLRCERGGREQLIRNFLAMWYTTERDVPDDFDLVKADLLPALRAKSFFEIDMKRAEADGKFKAMYETIGEHLALALAYDLPTSMMIVNEEALEKWGVTFYEAMEVARQNLADKPISYAEVGSLYALMNNDGYDATRLVLLELVRKLNVAGETIAMVPNRERLYIAGADDNEGLTAMLHFAQEDVQHERYISGIAFRLERDEWAPWLPPDGHPLRRNFRELANHTMGQMYTVQAELLNKHYEASQVDLFAASFMGLKNESTGEFASHCMWLDGLDSLLPQTDEVFLCRRQGNDMSILARCDWETVCRLAGDVMEPQGMYPERYRVREFPDDELLRRLREEMRDEG
jgi:hypothetical protein